VTVPTTERFHLGDMLSITTGRLVAQDKMDALYRLLNFMTDDSLFTHQLPRAAEECAPELVRQFPWLADIECPDFTDPAEVPPWVAAQVAERGEFHEVAPLAAADHTRIDPITELYMIKPDAEVIVIEIAKEAQR
jgi:hypothetical protein